MLNTLTDTLNVTGTLVTQNSRESTLRVATAESVRVGVTETRVLNLYTDLASLGRTNLDRLE